MTTSKFDPDDLAWILTGNKILMENAYKPDYIEVDTMEDSVKFVYQPNWWENEKVIEE